ncbi:MAG: hypothetical protein RLW61_10895 [Gammaproteobacteria bacterium]
MRALRVFVSLAIAALAAPTTAVKATPVIDISDTLEVGDPLDFLPFGGAVEIDDVGVLEGSVLVFNSAGNIPVFGYDSIRYELAREGMVPRRVSLGFDVQTSGLQGSTSHFNVIVDSSQVRNLVFRANGDIDTLNPGPGASGPVGTYVEGAPLRIDMQFDTVADRWTVRIDDTLVYDDLLGGTTIGSVRFAIGAASGNDPFDPAATAYLDNITIRSEDFVALPPAPVPLPAALWLSAGALPWLLRRRRS